MCTDSYAECFARPHRESDSFDDETLSLPMFVLWVCTLFAALIRLNVISFQENQGRFLFADF